MSGLEIKSVLFRKVGKFLNKNRATQSTQKLLGPVFWAQDLQCCTNFRSCPPRPGVACLFRDATCYLRLKWGCHRLAKAKKKRRNVMSESPQFLAKSWRKTFRATELMAFRQHGANPTWMKQAIYMTLLTRGEFKAKQPLESSNKKQKYCVEL